MAGQAGAEAAHAASDATDLGPPEHWRLKAQGNANAVFEYIGDGPHLVGRVLRVRKRSGWAVEPLERQAWAHLYSQQQLAQQLQCACRQGAVPSIEQLYVSQELAPLLGTEHLPPQEAVAPSSAFLETLQAAQRQSAGPSLDLDCTAPGAVLMQDATLLGPLRRPPPSAEGRRRDLTAEECQGPAVCLELKPKCGFVLACGTVHPENAALKRSASRYRLHQALKAAQARLDPSKSPSAYDPCDLFSGQPARVAAALAALAASPQNNLRAFVAGEPAAAGAAGLMTAAVVLTGLEEGAAVPAALGLLQDALQQEGVLGQLLHAQQTCRYDIEGIHDLYCHLVGQLDGGTDRALPAANGGDNANEAADAQAPPPEGAGADAAEHARWRAARRALLALPRREALAALRAYAVSATAKDCAIMATLRRLPPATADPSAALATLAGAQGVATDAASGVRAAYRLWFVDLDMKRLAKIPAHRALDQAIVAAARGAQRT